jgi:hypothetical protein
MSNIPEIPWCQKCGKYQGSGKTADTIIVLVKIRGRYLCQNHRPKTKKVEVETDTTQLLLEEKGRTDVSEPV